jgi:anti-sigma factor RsiW
MDSHDRHHRLLAAFLAGELNPADARRWDEHLLACEQCWKAVREDRAGRQAAQVLRQPPPPGLADRVRFAVELAAAGTIAEERPRHGVRLRWRWRWRWLAGAGALAATVAVTVAVLLLPGGREAASMPAAVAAVARYAETVPARQQEAGSGRPAAPVEVGRPVRVAAGGQRMVLRVWRLGRVEAVVAVSAQPFPMPSRARGVTGGGMAWTARLGKIGLYCRNGHTSELVAAPVPENQLAALAARLPPA